LSNPDSINYLRIDHSLLMIINYYIKHRL